MDDFEKSSVELNKYSEYQKRQKQLSSIREAEEKADRSKRNFVIQHIWSRITRRIDIICDEKLTKPLIKYGKILKNLDYPLSERYWRFYVDETYDFDLVLNVLKKIEVADDCVMEYLAAVPRGRHIGDYSSRYKKGD
jgi:hypothetical protein